MSYSGWKWLTGAVLAVAFALAAYLITCKAHASNQECASVWNVYSQRWEYVCVDRDEGDLTMPLCRFEWDPWNQVWVQVCE